MLLYLILVQAVLYAVVSAISYYRFIINYDMKTPC